MAKPTDLSHLLYDLRIAQRAAWERGEQFFVETYLDEHPTLAANEEAVLDFIYSEYCLREELGDRPDPAEFARRFPQWAESLLRLIELHQAIDDSDDSIASVGGDVLAPSVEMPLPDQPEYIGRYRVDRLLGQGGFGVVYLAHDDQLKRLVAVKVPHAALVTRIGQAEAYLREARTVANLDHPRIVPVYDVGSTEAFPCFVVCKYIDGIDLATKLKRERLTIHETVVLTMAVAEALHHAHKHGLVHRDIKPANILLDKHDCPYVADFGLALREIDVGKGARYAGTPVYMSPEQARGEGHRVDCRSDIFSLGIILYEMLTGRRPFRADSQHELLEQITSFDPRPPRQHDDIIPKELERICLKSLAKRASERYSTAKDMADDLKYFLSESPADSISSVTGKKHIETEVTTPVPTPIMSPVSDSQPIKIIPKGLRSFDSHDSDFFLELLPGARDRDNLPESIRFWKNFIEETDADNTFSVGLIYGPSGCGKSSLVKAGLLPHLSNAVIAVYVEATAEKFETRLLSVLRRRCPLLSENLSLKETLAALRRGQAIAAGKKVVIILDQFEQWLHGKREEHGSKLVQALRQCDGCRVQCIVMVRDDFWMSATRFMRELEVRLLEGQNSAAVDLFPMRHAERVLAAFGRAFGILPANSSDNSKDQQAFINQVVRGLAQEGKVISVRLALFAEMMKGKSWTPQALKEVGGTDGVGVTFLEETFSTATAPPEHRYHQNAARRILKALLPESGTDIKGHMRSYSELLEASGYASRTNDFEGLIRLLDNETRLITPSDRDGLDESPHLEQPLSTMNEYVGQECATYVSGNSEKSSSDDSESNENKYYQLTHDYLVPSLREWLTRKQRETHRGRKELLLADRAADWNSRPENRQLPTLLQYLNICWWTQRNKRTVPEQKMMRKASVYHLLRTGVAALMLAIIGVGCNELNGRIQARALRDRLLDANTIEVPKIVEDMTHYRRWLNPLLRDSWQEAETSKNSHRQLHTSLALLPHDATQVNRLCDYLLDAAPNEVPVIRDALVAHKDSLLDKLWARAISRDKGKERQRL